MLSWVTDFTMTVQRSHTSRLAQSHANQVDCATITTYHTETYQKSPDPCVIVKVIAIDAGVGWVWLVGLWLAVVTLDLGCPHKGGRGGH